MLRHHQSIWIDIIRGYMQRKHHVMTPSKYMDRYNSWIYAEDTSCYIIRGYMQKIHHVI